MVIFVCFGKIPTTMDMGQGRDNQTQFGFHHHPRQWKLFSRTWQFIIHYLGIKEFHNRFRVVIAPF